MSERENRYVIALDVGATNTRCALVNAQAEIIFLIKEGTRSGKTTSQIIGIIKKMTEKAASEGKNVAGIGIGIAALVDKSKGVIKYAPNIPGYVNIPLRRLIKEEIGTTPLISADSDLAAIGEGWVGAGRGCRNFILITLGTGLGCGIIIDGRIYTGQGFAGEFGHTLLTNSKNKCNCGAIGCLESLAAGPAIVRLAQKAIRNKNTMMCCQLKERGGNISPAIVFEAAEKKDKVALQIVEEVGTLIGIGLTNLIYLFHPQKILIGGGLSRVSRLLINTIRDTIQRRCYLIFCHLTSVDVEFAQLEDRAGIIGAAKLVFENIESGEE